MVHLFLISFIAFIRLQDDRKIVEERVNDLHAAEKMHEDGNHLCDELNALIKDGEEVLHDAEAIPTIYTTTLDAFISPLEAATELLKIIPENEEIALRLKATIKDAKTVQANLSHHANLWSQFVDERDNATDQLETKRKPLDEIGNKHIRSYEEVADDLDKLKVCMKIFILLITKMLSFHFLNHLNFTFILESS